MDNFFGEIGDDKRPEWEMSLQKLRVDDDKVRMDAACKLRHCVEKAVRELSTESFEKFEAVLHKPVSDLRKEQVSYASVVSSALLHRAGAP